MSDSTPPPTRVRQACEPCRRKKTKCPGERPACSFCTRLNQRCTYLLTSDTPVASSQKEHRVTKTKPDRGHSTGRVDRLEARVEQIMEAVNTLVERQTEEVPSRESRRPSTPLQSSPRLPQPAGVAQGQRTKFDEFRRPYPPFNVLGSLVDLYKEKIADQPLPLFDVAILQAQVGKFSAGLLDSFLAITARFSTDGFFEGVTTKAVEYYKSSAWNTLFRQVAEPTGSLDVLQSFCLLCLSEIYDGKMVRAWMASGIASRALICSNLAMAESGRPIGRKTELSRCCWSLFILDRIHGSSLRTLTAISDAAILPEAPPSSKQPLINSTSRGPTEPRMPDERDDGICSYALQLLTIWGRLMAYLKTIKQGKLEDAWSTNSEYQQIKSEMSRYETIFPEVHRFKNAKFHERTSTDLTTHRSYWAPWIFAQCLYHAIHCTLNHPFLHVARVHGQQRLRSPSFLQHAIDQTILHSTWIVQLLNMSDERSFPISDPFIAHLASVVATAQFFLRFSKDATTAARATRDFETLQLFVEGMAYGYPHLIHTREIRKACPARCTIQQLYTAGTTAKS
ncbi:hypothetical protein EDD36DRAFT_39323 [Exophiala viscosa]|uniref:Zn(2)-C6 fungal-type domain-containing protein n=1 Tax=Exophiala viscosa TaxID=2486360 RepID=A0AAN6E6E3_9EURO|nr:hypothetical protein EDD36DRAFT_39323 [Exophiala viscosa]